MSTPASSPRPPSESVAPVVRRYHVRALADPSVLARVLEQFVLRDLIPERVSAERLDADGLSIEVEVRGLSAHEAGHVARRIQSFPTVTSVLLHA